MIDAVEAWLLKTGGDIDLAVGAASMVQLLDKPTTYRIPATPAYASTVLLWENQVVSILDPRAWLFDSPLQDASYVALLAYQTAPMEPLKYGAMRLSEVPESIQVDDSMKAIPEEQLSDAVEAVCDSAFTAFGRSILIPNLESIFDQKKAATEY